MATQVKLPTAAHTHTIIHLHGLGSNATEFASEFFESQISDGRTLPEILPSIKWVFPTAPVVYSARFNVYMSQWFEMLSTFDPHDRLSTEPDKADRQLAAAAKDLMQIVKTEAKTIGYDHVFLGGISQGAAIALHCLLEEVRTPLAGFIGLSTWLEKASRVDPVVCKHCMQANVFLGHAEDDGVVDIKYGREARDGLIELGCCVDLQE